jgi:hypothetical protein
MTDEVKQNIKLLIHSTSTLALMALSYAMVWLVDWKLVVALVLAKLAAYEYERLVIEINKRDKQSKE